MLYQVKFVDLSCLPPADRVLSEKELAFFQTLKFPKRRTEWLGGRLALKTLVAQAARVSLTQVEVLPQETSGKPQLLVRGESAKWAYSITHSHGWAAAAVSQECRFLGIDLEKIQHRIHAWAEDFFHLQELTAMDDAFLTALWTRKEAVVKLLGTGLTLNSFDLRCAGQQIVFYGKALQVYQSLGAPQITLQTHEEPAGFMFSAAYAR